MTDIEKILNYYNKKQPDDCYDCRICDVECFFSDYTVITHNFDFNESENSTAYVNFVMDKLFEDEEIKYISFAFLDDQSGTKFNIQYQGDLDFYYLVRIVLFFLPEIEDHFFESSYEYLLRDGYYVTMLSKYTHFVIALNYNIFQIESKGCGGSYIQWTHDCKIGHVFENISSTGNRMWDDGDKMFFNEYWK